jgi:general stress protein 26
MKQNNCSMKPARFGFILMMSLLVSHELSAQSADSAKIKLKAAALDMMKSAGMCALITIDQQGRPAARMMDAFAPESDFVVWFGTNPRSRKVKEIRKNPSVCLYYSNPSIPGYVMLQGKAEMVNDPKEKEKRWKEGWKEFYPSRDKDYILIKVKPTRLEVVNYKLGMTGDKATWEAPFATFANP